MFSWTRTIKSLILGFTWSGAYGVSREITPADTSLGAHAWWIPFIVLCLLMLILLHDGLPAAEQREKELNRKKLRSYYDGPSNREQFKNRMRFIQRISDKHMESAQYGKLHPVREHVVMPWEDLLKIWNIANLAESETPVED